MGWLPPPPDSALHARRAWTPPGLGDARTDDLSYLVVDEIVGTSVGLALSPWPSLDDRGRLRFVGGAPKTLGADRLTLESFLADHRLPRELAERPPRIGDVFAVRTIESALALVEEELAGPSRLQPFLAPENWIEPPVYDVTPDAREAAKKSFYGAVAPILAPTEAARLDEIVERAPELPPLDAPPQPPRPWFRPNLPWLAATTVLVAGGIAAGAALGGDSGRSTGTVTVTEGTTDVQTTTETTTTTESTTETEVSTTTETTTTTETAATTETVTTTETVSTTPPPPPPIG